MKIKLFNVCSPKIVFRVRKQFLLIIMRTFLLLFFTTALGFNADMGYSQAQVNIESSGEITVDEVFQLITEQTSYNFLYPDGLFAGLPKVKLVKGVIKINKLIAQSIPGSRFNVVLSDGNNIIIVESRSVNQIAVSGTVTDANGIPIPDVYIRIKGTSVGVVTNFDGEYEIVVMSTNNVLIFNSLGFKEKEVLVGDRLVLDVVLDLDVTELDAVEVVSTGYQNIQEQRVAGAVTSISNKELHINGVSTVEQMLQGKVAGLNVTNLTGEVGVRQKSRVRGTSTFLGNQEPIWVVDGIVQEDPLPFNTQTFDNNGGITQDNFDFIRNYVGNSIAWLNPNDIQDITVLKDASATAIYGVRAANGVIVIRTKQGREGPLSVTYSTNFNFGEKVTYDKLELMNSRERVAVSREIFERGLIATRTNNDVGFAGALNNYLFGEISYDEFNGRVAKMESVNTDWFDILYRNPFSQSHHVGFSGGSSKVRFYSSIGYADNQGTAIGNESKSLNASVGINSQLNEKLSISFRLSGSKAETDGFYLVSPYDYATKINRVIPAYDEDGSLFYYKDESNGYLYNYINERNESANSNTVQSLNSNVNVIYTILPELNLNVLGSYNISSTMGNSYATETTNLITAIRGYEYATLSSRDPLYARSKLPIGGVLNTDNNQSANWNLRANLNYNKIFNNVHYFSTLLGVESQSLKYDGFNSTTYGYLHSRGRSFALVPPTITSGTTVLANSLYTGTADRNKFSNAVTDRKTNTLGYYLTLNYTYDNRYVLNFSVRGDASNRFGQFPNEKFNPVWAGGLRWNAGNEGFIRDIDWISNLSLRGTFGYQRNMAVNFSPSLIVQIPSTTASARIYDANTGDYLLQIKNLPYEDLRWEQTTTYNLGFDLSLFKNKIFFSGNYYEKNGKDIITPLSLPAEYGIETMPVNGGSLRNRGYELTAGFTPVRTQNFNWSVNMNTAKNFNEVTKVGTQNNGWQSAIQGTLLKEGYPLSSFWAFKFDGVDPETGRPIIDLSVEEGTFPSEDPTAYLEYVGKGDPDFTAGFGNTFRYKQFSLSASFYLQLGGKKFLKSAYPTAILPNEYDNLSSELNGRWTPENPSAQLPGLPDQDAAMNPILLPGETLTYVPLYQMYNYSTDRVVDASSLRLNTLNTSYNFPSSFCENLKCKSLNVGLSASNVFSIVSKDFQGRDPEVARGNQPRTRSYTFNVNVTF
ncbi:MAG: SusC/RagA family TonB-linked outer membrane protein [Flavobacteriaceae bacterium]|nr:SusC/RagA family TonB-linked outer membrane protein [Flavobacteriaceae bacterium]